MNIYDLFLAEAPQPYAGPMCTKVQWPQGPVDHSVIKAKTKAGAFYGKSVLKLAKLSPFERRMGSSLSADLLPC